MNELEWLTTDDAVKMLDWLGPPRYDASGLGEPWQYFRASRQTHSAALIREIFGNPFRKRLWFEIGEWFDLMRCQNGLIQNIATDIHNTDDWQATSVLADALEEAGCTIPEILNHLRGTEPCPWCGPLEPEPHIYPPGCPWCKGTRIRPAVHVRGCWALSLFTTTPAG